MLLKLPPSKARSAKRVYVRTFRFVGTAPQIDLDIKVNVANSLVQVSFSTQKQDCPIPFGMSAIVITPNSNGGFVLSAAESDGVSLFFDTKEQGFELSFYGRALMQADPHNATSQEVPIRYSPRMIAY